MLKLLNAAIHKKMVVNFMERGPRPLGFFLVGVFGSGGRGSDGSGSECYY